MNPRIPHFGVLVDEIKACLERVTSDADLSKTPTLLSERTLRTIALGQRVEQKTWEEYAKKFIRVLLACSLFPLDDHDRLHLTRVFHGYRSSYEQLNDLITPLQGSRETVQRAVIRLSFMDAAVRYAALCLWLKTPPPDEHPLWGTRDGANSFWRQALEKRFPGLPLVDSAEPDGDCASRLNMNRSKMTRCLYENDFPGLPALKLVFPSSGDLAGALRHYAAYGLIQRLAERFGWVEVEFWTEKMAVLAKWLFQILGPICASFGAEKGLKLIKRMFMGGIDDSMIKRLLRDKLAGRILRRFRSDLLALANGDAIGCVRTYLEFCDYVGEAPIGACWEFNFDTFQIEHEGFRVTGRFPTKKTPSARLQLSRLLLHAQRTEDKLSEERILRQIINLHPLDGDAHQLLAQLFREQGRLEEAWGEFEIAAQIDPTFSLPLFNLANSKSVAGLHAEALHAAERIPLNGIAPGSRDFLLGVCLIRARRYSEAIPHLEKAFKDGWEPGSSAALLSHAHLQNSISAPASRLHSRKCEKQALHHGVEVPLALRTNQISLPCRHLR